MNVVLLAGRREIGMSGGQRPARSRIGLRAVILEKPVGRLVMARFVQ